ncbi:MAG: hypothetical protein ABSD53_20455 [Terriglobales bacterium]|jgi:hypothetical protein
MSSPSGPAIPPPSGRQKNTLYASPDEALKKVSSEFEYWTGKLTETSLQMCYALIAANWLVFGSVNGILASEWAKFSLLSVMIALAVSVVGAWILSEALRQRVEYGECDSVRWAKEFNAAAGQRVAWPFTDDMETIGRWMRWIKAGLTLLGGVLLIMGAILKAV